MKARIWMVLGVGILLTGCATKASLSGAVKHERTLGLVPDARVVITGGEEPETLQTNYAGRFQTKVKPGKYKLELKHERLQPCAGNPAEIELTEGEVRELSLCMTDG